MSSGLMGQDPAPRIGYPVPPAGQRLASLHGLRGPPRDHGEIRPGRRVKHIQRQASAVIHHIRLHGAIDAIRFEEHPTGSGSRMAESSRPYAHLGLEGHMACCSQPMRSGSGPDRIYRFNESDVVDDVGYCVSPCDGRDLTVVA